VHLKLETKASLDALDTIIWQPLLDSTLTRALDEQHFLPLQSWRVRVSVVDSNGCTATDEILVRLEKPRNIYVPNVFKPEDGLDPKLYIFGGRDVAIIESFLIFDRWGTQLFEQVNFQPNDPANGWDGLYKGEPLNPGVFVYQAKVRFIDGEIILYKGDITIVR
jgi:CHU_C Type IX secretion signal domain